MLLPEISDLFKSELIVFRLTATVFGTLKWTFPFISCLSWILFPKSYTSFFVDFFFSFGETSHPVTSWEKEWLGSKLLRCYITENVIYSHTSILSLAGWESLGERSFPLEFFLHCFIFFLAFGVAIRAWCHLDSWDFVYNLFLLSRVFRIFFFLLSSLVWVYFYLLF